MDVLPDLRRMTAELPLRESFQARLMLALYRSGRQSEALDVYRHARDVLDRELGVEPGQELEALQRAVLPHDPKLGLEAPTGPERPSARPADAGGLAEPDATVDQSLDPETARVPLDGSFQEIRAVLERKGGTIEQVVGDAVMADFGVPLVHEDDALRAVRAASEMRDVLASLTDCREAELAVG